MKLPGRSITKYLRYGSKIRPDRDWLLLLALFFIAIMASTAWNLWEFSRVINGQQIGSVPIPPSPQIQVTSVESVFDSRAQERARYRDDYRFIDPSL